MGAACNVASGREVRVHRAVERVTSAVPGGNCRLIRGDTSVRVVRQ
jgi:hypothetical protein